MSYAGCVRLDAFPCVVPGVGSRVRQRAPFLGALGIEPIDVTGLMEKRLERAQEQAELSQRKQERDELLRVAQESADKAAEAQQLLLSSAQTQLGGTLSMTQKVGIIALVAFGVIQLATTYLTRRRTRS